MKHDDVSGFLGFHPYFDRAVEAKVVAFINVGLQLDVVVGGDEGTVKADVCQRLGGDGGRGGRRGWRGLRHRLTHI